MFKREPVVHKKATLSRRKRRQGDAVISGAHFEREEAQVAPLHSHLPPIKGGGIEVCAGTGSLSIAYHFHGLVPEILYEIDHIKREALKIIFPNAKIFGDVRDARREQMVTGRTIYVVYGGVPCQPCAQSGKQLGLADARAPVTTDAVPSVASLCGAIMTKLEIWWL